MGLENHWIVPEKNKHLIEDHYEEVDCKECRNWVEPNTMAYILGNGTPAFEGKGYAKALFNTTGINIYEDVTNHNVMVMADKMNDWLSKQVITNTSSLWETEAIMRFYTMFRIYGMMGAWLEAHA